MYPIQYPSSKYFPIFKVTYAAPHCVCHNGFLPLPTQTSYFLEPLGSPFSKSEMYETIHQGNLVMLKKCNLASVVLMSSSPSSTLLIQKASCWRGF